jgi:hypothetical protein
VSDIDNTKTVKWYEVFSSSMYDVDVVKETKLCLYIKSKDGYRDKYLVRKISDGVVYVKDLDQAKQILKENLDKRVKLCETRLEMARECRKRSFKQYGIEEE